MTEFNRILLLQAPVPGPHNRMVAKPSAIPPLGLGYLASVLLVNGFEVRIVDMDIEDVDAEGLIDILNLFQPGLVGISTTTMTFKNGIRIAKVVKQVVPDCLVCLGGPHVTVMFKEALRFPFVDIVVRGEGENTFIDLCKSLFDGKNKPIEIAGTVWRSENNPIIFPKRKRIRKLDDLPYPARHLMPLNLYNIPGTILTSRGCPFSCGFCAGPTVLGKVYSARSARNVVAEVQRCVDIFGLTSFYFVDDTMTHDTKRLMEICEGLVQLKVPASLGRKIKWTCESRADVVTTEILQEMRRAGCTTIQFGMESGSQELLDKLGKKITLKQIQQAVISSRKCGISPVLSMVFPHPEENERTIKETFDFIRLLYDHGAEKIIPALLTLFPGTRFMDQREQLGLKLLTEDFEEYNLGTPILKTRHLDLNSIANYYSQILILTQELGGSSISGIEIKNNLSMLEPLNS